MSALSNSPLGKQISSQSLGLNQGSTAKHTRPKLVFTAGLLKQKARLLLVGEAFCPRLQNASYCWYPISYSCSVPESQPVILCEYIFLSDFSYLNFNYFFFFCYREIQMQHETHSEILCEESREIPSPFWRGLSMSSFPSAGTTTEATAIRLSPLLCQIQQASSLLTELH